MKLDKSKKVTVLVDNDSWILPYAKRLVKELRVAGIETKLVRSAREIEEGWICFLLGCIHIVEDIFLDRNRHNLVVHESNLPKGRGFAPMAWQILEGVSSIPVCLLEASREKPDAGYVWLQDTIELSGNEFLPEWRRLQGLKTIAICKRFIDDYDVLRPREQQGMPSYYKRRTPENSRLDLNKTLKEQINLLRIVDNDRYPAYIVIDGVKVTFKIYKEEYGV